MGASPRGFLEARTLSRAYAKWGKELIACERELEALLKQASRRGGGAARAAPRVFDRLGRLHNDMLALNARLDGERFRPVGNYASLLRAELRISQRLRGRALRAPLGFFNPEKLIFKVTHVLGVEEAWREIKDYFDRFESSLIEQIRRAIRNRDWKKLRRLLIRLFEVLKSPQFIRWFRRNVAKEVAERVLKKLALRLLPVVGQLILIGQILGAIIGQFFID